jgi:hypothetical protein
MVEGNHEFRLLRHLTEATPALVTVLSDLHGMTIPDLLGIKKYEVNYIARMDLAAFSNSDVNHELRKNYYIAYDSILFHHFPHGFDMGYPGVNGHHHKHYHPNSYLSGIIYLNADKLQDKIYFVRPGRDFFNIQTENYNLSNSETWFFTTGTKDIVIFPSKLEHYVEVAPSEETRISLSFNTFFKGSIGIDHSLTELKL